MDKFSYAGVLIVFLTPVIYWILKTKQKQIKKRKLLIVYMGIFGALGFFITMPLGAAWDVWLYNYDKTSNIRIGKEVIETFIWSIISCIILAIVVDAMASKEEKIHTNRHKKKSS